MASPPAVRKGPRLLLAAFSAPCSRTPPSPRGHLGSHGAVSAAVGHWGRAGACGVGVPWGPPSTHIRSLEHVLKDEQEAEGAHTFTKTRFSLSQKQRLPACFPERPGGGRTPAAGRGLQLTEVCMWEWQAPGLTEGKPAGFPGQVQTEAGRAHGLSPPASFSFLLSTHPRSSVAWDMKSTPGEKRRPCIRCRSL